MKTTTKGGSFSTCARRTLSTCGSVILSALNDQSVASESDSVNGLRGGTLELVRKLTDALELARAADSMARMAQDAGEEVEAREVGPRAGGHLADVRLRIVADPENGGAVEWIGTLREMIEANVEDLDTCEAAQNVARDGISRKLGGGAQPVTTIERVAS